MTLTYHKCNLEDLDILVKISSETFSSAFEKDNNSEDFKDYINTAFSKVQLEKELLNKQSIFYFVYKSQHLIGYLKLNIKEAQNEDFEVETMELERIYVIKPHQNKGYGKLLLLESIAIAKSKNVSFLWLGVWEENKAAIRFYIRHGFEKVSTHPYYIGNDKQTDWIMKLDCI